VEVELKRISLVLGLLCAAVTVCAQNNNPWVYRGNPKWDGSWNNRPLPRAGACFFKEAGFQGDRFCVTRGDKLDSLPGNLGDNISSMQLFGNVRATVFNDRGFRAGNRSFAEASAIFVTRDFATATPGITGSHR